MTIAPSITVTSVGVFGDTEGATLSNINITDIDVSGDGDIGTLAGSCRNSSIINCHSSGQVTSNRSLVDLLAILQTAQQLRILPVVVMFLVYIRQVAYWSYY